MLCNILKYAQRGAAKNIASHLIIVFTKRIGGKYEH